MDSKNSGEKVFDVINIIMVGLFSLTTIYPLVYVVAVSLSSSRAILSGEVVLYPVDITFRPYVNLFQDGQIIRGFFNSVILTSVGVLINLVFSSATAYALTKKRLAIRNVALMAIMFTMLFSGGMIPVYLLLRNLNLLNKYMGLWLSTLIPTYYLFVMKTHFSNMPVELEEAAYLDGANEIQILFKVILPLSLPTLAALSLFYAVDWWNAYTGILIYISDREKYTLMVVLYNMLEDISSTVTQGLGETAKDIEARKDLIPENIRAAAVVFALVPILMVYPFLQRYFVKGILIGSIKG